MTKEIAFEPKTLWFGALVAVIAGGYLKGIGTDWAGSIFNGFMAGAAAQVVFLYLLTPIAQYLHATVVEGVPRSFMLAIVLVFYSALGLYIYLLLSYPEYFTWFGKYRAWGSKLVSENGWLAALVLVIVTAGWWIIADRMWREREARNKRNVIDLSKSRDLTLK